MLVTVTDGTVIMKKSPATPGVYGTSIFGRTIDPHPGEDIPLPAGENTEVIDNGTKLVAKTDGYLYRNTTGIHVRQLFTIKGNVDYSTGNITYPGEIYIRGNIISGFKVESGKNIFIQGEVEAAEVRSKKGTIAFEKGVFGKGRAVISSGETIHAEFIQEAHVNCVKDLFVKKSILNVKARVGGSIILEDTKQGCIIGGEIFCNGSVYAAEIGNDQQVKTIISISAKESSPLKARVIQTNKKKAELKGKLMSVRNEMEMKAKMFKIKAHKTIKEKEELESLLHTFYSLKRELESIERLSQFFKNKEQSEIAIGTISVSRVIYPDVVLRFGKLEKKIMSRVGPATFVIEEGKIIMKPFRKKNR